ncbi:MAG: membrane protein insertase YidC [Gammaproteobacteria bacterium]|nr:membrane protein insertase YidC [Gammaproteobacteria bacterium]
MEARRIFLYLALGLILIMIWTNWQSEHAPEPARKGATTPVAATRQEAASPTSAAQTAQVGGTNAAPAVSPVPMPGQLANVARLQAPPGPRITVRTDVMAVKLALDGATLVSAKLLEYEQKLGSQKPVALLDTQKNEFLTVSPLLVSAQLPQRLTYQAGAKDYQLAPGAQTLMVPVSWSGQGLRVTRRFVFTRGSYEVRVETEISNRSGETIHLQPGIRIVGDNPETAAHFWEMFLPEHWTYRGPSWYNEEYNKLEAASLASEPFEKTFSGGWIASVNQYFVAAAIPDADRKAHYFGRPVSGVGYAIGYLLPPVAVTGGQSRTIGMKLYLGPKLQGHLDAVAPGLSRTVDYGHATIISQPLFWILGFINDFLGNWGWSIVVLVLLIKAVFYFPQRMSARSMAKMRKLQPRLKLLKERYKDDKKKLSEATMKLYREEGANPVSGCLPMLIQVPIFIGLFYVLIYSVELRHAPWVLWIQDLSAPDPYYILPIIFAVLMLVQFRLQPQAVDNAQAKMMMVMPLGMAFLYAIFPSGLVLYYLLNTLLNIAIQWQVNRELGIPLDLIPKGWKQKLKGS